MAILKTLLLLSLVESYSIKQVFPTLYPDYHNLDDVRNGGDAANVFAAPAGLVMREKEKLRANRLKYCALDTYAMVKILRKLREITKPS